jgi:hypothetical protein
MGNWIQLAPKLVHNFYCVPFEIATAEGNTFFGMERHPCDLDGPWPFLALLRDNLRPDIVTLHIFNLVPEALEFDGFNPLTETGGSLTLEHKGLVDLVSLLREYAQQLPATHESDHKMFKKIEDSEASDFHLHPEWFPNSRRYHYYQNYNPLDRSNGSSAVTILILSLGPTQQATSRLSLKIASFPLQKLQDPSFNPLDDSLARIHLDRNGMQELAALLRAQLDHLTG